MHRTLRPFELLEPESLDEALSILDSKGMGAKVLAGGLDLLSKMTRWEIEPSCLVSLGRIPGIDFLETRSDGHLRIGPMTTLRSVEVSPLVETAWQLLRQATGQIASVQVRTMGTLVGNLCVATPASDIAPALYALDAVMHLVGPQGARTVPIEDFFVPDCCSILAPEEIVGEVTVPPVPPGTGTAFKKLAHTKACIAKINVAVLLERDGDLCRKARIALGAVGPTVIRARAAEDALTDVAITPALITSAAADAADATAPITDIRSTAEYRRDMAAVLVRRALGEAWDTAGAPQTPVTPSLSAGHVKEDERP